MPHPAGEFINLAVQFVVACLIWSYYRHRTLPPDEKYFTFAPRFWAGMVDSCVLSPLGLLVGLSFLLHLPPTVGVLLDIFTSVIGLTYTIWMHAHRGQTVGKIVCKVRVVDNRTEGAITTWQALVRECVPLLVNIIFTAYLTYLVGTGQLAGEAMAHPEKVWDERLVSILVGIQGLWFLLELLTMFTNDKRRALHDFIAGTSVVRTNLVSEPLPVSAPLIS